MSKGLLWIGVAVAVVIAVAIAMIVGLPIGLTSALPQPQSWIPVHSNRTETEVVFRKLYFHRMMNTRKLYFQRMMNTQLGSL